MQFRQRETRQAEYSDSESSVEEEEEGGGGAVYRNTRSRRGKKGRRTVDEDPDYQPHHQTPQQQPKRQATSTLKLRTTTKKQRNDIEASSSSSVTPRSTGRSIYDMNIVEINDTLKQHLKGQDESMDRLTDILFRFNQRPLPGSGGGGGGGTATKKCILPLMLSGVSGTGKTTTAKLLKKLYDIGDTQYIKHDLTRMTDETQVNILLGSGPGLVGSASRATLPMDLLRAIGRAPTGKMDVDLTEEQYQQRMKQYRTTPERLIDNVDAPHPPPPRTILLHFEETDKAYNKFMTLMLNFIEDGELTASNSEIKFVLPDETRLIIVFSANFASKRINTLCPFTQYTEARESISEAIEAYGVPRAVLGRLPYLLPFFVLDEETMRQISHDMVLQVLDDREHAYRAQFSHVEYDNDDNNSDDNASRSVIEVIRSIYAIGCSNETTNSDDLGMRGLEAGLETFKTELYYGIASCLLRSHAMWQMEQQKQPLLLMQQSDIEEEAPLRRVTRSISQTKQQPLVSTMATTTSTGTIIPYLSYRVFAYPDELSELMRDSPHAFSRSVRSQIEMRLKQGLEIGLLMVHVGKQHQHQHPLQQQLLLCIVNRALPCLREQPQQPHHHHQQRQRLTYAYPNNNNNNTPTRLTLVGVPQRRVLLASRQIIRCQRCHSSHGKNEPCDDILDCCEDINGGGGSNENYYTCNNNNNSADMVEFAFHSLKQHGQRYRYPLLMTPSREIF